MVKFDEKHRDAFEECLDGMALFFWLLLHVLELVSVLKSVRLGLGFFLLPSEWLGMLDRGNLGRSLNLHESLVGIVHVLISIIKLLSCFQ